MNYNNSRVWLEIKSNLFKLSQLFDLKKMVFSTISCIYIYIYMFYSTILFS